MKIENSTPLVVDTTNNWLWNFYFTKGEAEYVCKQMNETNNVYEVIDYEELTKRDKAKWITGKITKIDEEKFWYALEVLPPLKWYNNGVLETFCMSEMMTGTFTEQYACFDDKYYCKMVDITDKSTWITITDLEKLV